LKVGTHLSSAHKFEIKPELKITASENPGVGNCRTWYAPGS
jgi:hypothetical protein